MAAVVAQVTIIEQHRVEDEGKLLGFVIGNADKGYRGETWFKAEHGQYSVKHSDWETPDLASMVGWIDDQHTLVNLYGFRVIGE